MPLVLIGLGMLLLAGAFLACSLKRIETSHIAAVTFLGRRTGETKAEGYRLFPFYPLVYSYIPVPVTKEHQELRPQAVRSRDWRSWGELQVAVRVTWTPDPRHVRSYLDYGETEQVRRAEVGRARQPQLLTFACKRVDSFLY